MISETASLNKHSSFVMLHLHQVQDSDYINKHNINKMAEYVFKGFFYFIIVINNKPFAWLCHWGDLLTIQSLQELDYDFSTQLSGKLSKRL